MKLKINKACDLGSISVLPPRRTGGSGSAGASSAAASQQQQQQRSQTLSQQSLSQGAGGSGPGPGGASSLLYSQSQLSQASLDENLLGLQLTSPTRDQIFGLNDDSSKKMPSLPASSGSCVREESQLQLPKLSTNHVHRWNPSLPDSRCQIANEDVERKFQHLASSVHKIGMVLDSVQNDVMHLNRAMKEASLDSGSIQQKVVLLDNSLQKVLKGQDSLKALVEASIKNNADQLSVTKSNSSKLDEISSTLAVWPKQIESDLRQLQSDMFRAFTKEMEGIVVAIRSLSSRSTTMQMPTDQSCTTNGRPLVDELPVAHERPLVSQTAVPNARPLENQTPTENGRPLMTQTPAVNVKTLIDEIPAANRRPSMCQKSAANRRPQMKRTPLASGWAQTNQVPAPNVNSAPWVRPVKVGDTKLKVEQGKLKALPQKLTGSGTRLMPKQEEVPNRLVTKQATDKKAPIMIFIDSDDDSEGRASCVTLKTESAYKEFHLTKEDTEESQQILRRARKRRKREMLSIVLT